MTIKSFFEEAGLPPPEDPHAKLETSYIEAFLNAKGYQLREVHQLPEALGRALMIEACIYASNKLAEVEVRSRLVDNLHGKA